MKTNLSAFVGKILVRYDVTTNIRFMLRINEFIEKHKLKNVNL